MQDGVGRGEYVQPDLVCDPIRVFRRKSLDQDAINDLELHVRDMGVPVLVPAETDQRVFVGS